jgi:hypothetical protein
MAELSARTLAEMHAGRRSVLMAQAWHAADEFERKWRRQLKDVELHTGVTWDETIENYRVIVRLFPGGELASEPAGVFPSDKLNAQMMLIAG